MLTSPSMRPSLHYGRAFAFGATSLVSLFSAAWPGVARAQTASVTTTLSPAFPDRNSNNPTLGALVPRSGNYAQDISFDDCEKDIKLTFHIILGGAFATAGGSLQVWAGVGGADCSQTTQRQALTPASRCNPVAPTRPSPLPQSLTVDVFGRDLAWASQPPAATETQYSSYNVKQDERTACHLQQQSAGVPIVLWFLVVDPSGVVINNPIKFTNITTDTLGPQPLKVTGDKTAGKIGVGSQLLKISWTLPNPQDNDFNGVRIFANPPPGKDLSDAAAEVIPNVPATVCASPTANDGGVSTTTDAQAPVSIAPFDDAGLDGGADADADADAASDADAGQLNDAAPTEGGTSDAGTTCTNDFGPAPDYSNCSNPSSIFVAGTVGGVVPEFYHIGDVTGAAQTEFSATGLINGNPYYFAVAPVDTRGNVGPLTPLGCDYPQEINDFWDNYKNGHGGAGGSSFCALEAPGAPTAYSVFALGIAGVGIGLHRRRSSRRSKK